MIREKNCTKMFQKQNNNPSKVMKFFINRMFSINWDVEVSLKFLVARALTSEYSLDEYETLNPRKTLKSYLKIQEEHNFKFFGDVQVNLITRRRLRLVESVIINGARVRIPNLCETTNVRNFFLDNICIWNITIKKANTIFHMEMNIKNQNKTDTFPEIQYVL